MTEASTSFAYSFIWGVYEGEEAAETILGLALFGPLTTLRRRIVHG